MSFGILGLGLCFGNFGFGDVGWSGRGLKNGIRQSFSCTGLKALSDSLASIHSGPSSLQRQPWEPLQLALNPSRKYN